jgi:hypothetical protein
MPNLPYKLLLFVAVGGFFYLYGLPKRAKFVTDLLSRAKNQSREQQIEALAEAKVRGDICSISDLCEYRPIAWKEFQATDTTSASIVHEFYTDGKKRTMLFRMRYGALSEVIDLN